MFVAIAFASGEENHGQVTITTVNIDETIQEMEEDIPEFPVWKEKSVKRAQRHNLLKLPETGWIAVTFSKLNNCESDLSHSPQYWCDSELTYDSSSTGGGSDPVTVEVQLRGAEGKVEINGISMNGAVTYEDAKNLNEMIFQAYESTKESKRKGSSNESSEGSKTVKIMSDKLDQAVKSGKLIVTQAEEDVGQTSDSETEE